MIFDKYTIWRLRQDGGVGKLQEIMDRFEAAINPESKKTEQSGEVSKEAT